MHAERNSTAPTQETFLGLIHHRLIGARQGVSTLVDKCAMAGFYGPPQDAIAKENPQAENTPRANIIEELDRLQANIDILTHQLERMA